MQLLNISDAEWLKDTAAVCGLLVALSGAAVVVIKLGKAVRNFARRMEAIAAFARMWVGEDGNALTHQLDNVEQESKSARAAITGRLDAVQAAQQRTDSRLDEMQTAQQRTAARVDEIHHEVHPNSGGSLRDSVTRTEKRMEATEEKVDGLRNDLADSRADRAALHEEIGAMREEIGAVQEVTSLNSHRIENLEHGR